MNFLILNLIGFLIAGSTYSEPDCHDLLANRQQISKVREFSSRLDKCLWYRLKVSDPLDASWFRCATRRPSGISGFTPNSLEALLSQIPVDSDHFRLAQATLAHLCKEEDEFLPFDLLRFHIANVLKVNMLIAGSATPNPYSKLYETILRDPGHGKGDILWHLLNVVGSFHLRNQKKTTQTWISAALDAWLVQRVHPETTEAINETFQAYWHSILKHMDHPFLMHVDEDVGHPLLEMIGDVYASSLQLDVNNFLKKLRGIRERITRLDALLPLN